MLTMLRRAFGLLPHESHALEVNTGATFVANQWNGGTLGTGEPTGTFLVDGGSSLTVSSLGSPVSLGVPLVISDSGSTVSIYSTSVNFNTGITVTVTVNDGSTLKISGGTEATNVYIHGSSVVTLGSDLGTPPVGFCTLYIDGWGIESPAPAASSPESSAPLLAILNAQRDDTVGSLFVACCIIASLQCDACNAVQCVQCRVGRVSTITH
jgi:hypothetical protein